MPPESMVFSNTRYLEISRNSPRSVTPSGPFTDADVIHAFPNLETLRIIQRNFALGRLPNFKSPGLKHLDVKFFQL